MTPQSARKRFQWSLGIFFIGLVLSGVTAFPLLLELQILARWLGVENAVSAQGYTGLSFWILTVRLGLEETYSKYPWVAYGTDWLAFGHLIIALFFIDPFRHPERSRPNLYVGIAACLSVLPLAFVCGPLRGIPIYWRFIDSAFGLFGILPLLYCLRLLPTLESPAHLTQKT